MAEAEYSTTAKLPIDTIWSYVRDMDNWAHFLMGYLEHEKHDDMNSTSTLR